MRPEGDVDSLLKLMDECNIEKAVAFAPFFSQWKTHEGNPISWLAGEVRQHEDRLVGYAAINPESDYKETGICSSDSGLFIILLFSCFYSPR